MLLWWCRSNGYYKQQFTINWHGINVNLAFCEETSGKRTHFATQSAKNIVLLHYKKNLLSSLHQWTSENFSLIQETLNSNDTHTRSLLAHLVLLDFIVYGYTLSVTLKLELYFRLKLAPQAQIQSSLCFNRSNTQFIDLVYSVDLNFSEIMTTYNFCQFDEMIIHIIITRPDPCIFI